MRVARFEREGTNWRSVRARNSTRNSREIQAGDLASQQAWSGEGFHSTLRLEGVERKAANERSVGSEEVHFGNPRTANQDELNPMPMLECICTGSNISSCCFLLILLERLFTTRVLFFYKRSDDRSSNR